MDQARSGRRSEVASALHQVLVAATPQSRNARLQLIRHLVDVESQTVCIERPKTLGTANDLISTAQAAELLGYSRPYVTMLIDQNKLKGGPLFQRAVIGAFLVLW